MVEYPKSAHTAQETNPASTAVIFPRKRVQPWFLAHISGGRPYNQTGSNSARHLPLQQVYLYQPWVSSPGGFGAESLAISRLESLRVASG